MPTCEKVSAEAGVVIGVYSTVGDALATKGLIDHRARDRNAVFVA
jgi:hypothetical protein